MHFMLRSRFSLGRLTKTLALGSLLWHIHLTAIDTIGTNLLSLGF